MHRVATSWRRSPPPRAGARRRLRRRRRGGGRRRRGRPKPETLKIGLIPIADVAPVFLGQKQGFFKEEDITLEPQFAAGGAAITPAVVSGDFDIGFSNTVSMLIAASKDLPIQIISQGVLGRHRREEGVGRPARREGQPRDQGPEGARGQDDRRQHAQQHLRRHDQRLARGGGRRRLEDQVHGDPVPGDERRAREGQRRRRLPGRAVRQRRARRPAWWGSTRSTSARRRT